MPCISSLINSDEIIKKCGCKKVIQLVFYTHFTFNVILAKCMDQYYFDSCFSQRAVVIHDFLPEV